MKVCGVCKIDKKIEDFGKDSRKKDGLKYLCKKCFNKKYKMSKEDKKNYYQKNKHKWSEYYLENKDEISEYKKEYREINKDYLKEKAKEYVENNKENLKVKWEIYRNKNKVKIKEWFENNKEYRKDYKKEYNNKNKSKRSQSRKNRRSNDIIYRIKENIRCRISLSIKGKGFKKKSKTYTIIGCEYSELKSYLESKFENWMNWENYGLYNGELNYGWDIDHIIPLSSAQTEEDIIKLNHFTNLQPLCSKVNRDIKKNNI
jgi:hypothetical protein